MIPPEDYLHAMERNG